MWTTSCAWAAATRDPFSSPRASHRISPHAFIPQRYYMTPPTLPGIHNRRHSHRTSPSWALVSSSGALQAEAAAAATLLLSPLFSVAGWSGLGFGSGGWGVVGSDSNTSATQRLSPSRLHPRVPRFHVLPAAPAARPATCCASARGGGAGSMAPSRGARMTWSWDAAENS
jgi:hypothetical protein